MISRRLLLLHPPRMSGENHGVYIQHVASMQWLLGEVPGWEIVALDALHPRLGEVALTSDVVVVHMLGTPEIESLIRLRRERGLRTLYEISDNFLDLGGWLPKNHSLRNPLVRQQILYHASLADGIQVYSSGLADLMRHVNAKVVLLDPYVPLARRAAREDGPFVFGWGGTTSHATDLQRIAPAIASFCRRHPEVVFSYMGDTTLFASSFGEIPSAQTRVRPFGLYAEYLDFVSSLDVGLAPLGASAFNACRTDTKFATYAARGVASVLEDSDVYRVHADRALLFASAGELDAALESLYADPARRARLAERAAQWAERERGLHRLRAQRLAAYEPLLPRQPRDHGAVETGPEHALLSSASAITDDNAAVAAVEPIVAGYPRYEQARLALARWYAGRGDHQAAFELLDHEFGPLFADLAAEMQARVAREVRPEEVASCEARVASPLARVRIEHRNGDAREYLKALLARQPYDYVALANAIRELLASDPSSPELPELFRRACLVAPKLVPAEHRPPALAKYLPA